MEARKYVFRKTAALLLGDAVCCGIMFAVYAVLGRLDGRVLLGGAAGTALGCLNFFAMAMIAQRASDMAVGQDVKGGAALMRFSYIGRLVVLFLALALLAKSGLVDPLACVLPVAFSHLVLTVPELFKKMGGNGG